MEGLDPLVKDGVVNLEASYGVELNDTNRDLYETIRKEEPARTTRDAQRFVGFVTAAMSGDFSAMGGGMGGFGGMFGRGEEGPEALLTPEQAFFVRENVKLRLLNARLALLSRQYDIAQADLRDAQSMIERYFDRGSRRVGLAAEQLRQLTAQARQVALPRPDATLAALATAVAGR